MMKSSNCLSRWPFLSGVKVEKYLSMRLLVVKDSVRVGHNPDFVKEFANVSQDLWETFAFGNESSYVFQSKDSWYAGILTLKVWQHERCLITRVGFQDMHIVCGSAYEIQFYDRKSGRFQE